MFLGMLDVLYTVFCAYHQVFNLAFRNMIRVYHPYANDNKQNSVVIVTSDGESGQLQEKPMTLGVVEGFEASIDAW